MSGVRAADEDPDLVAFVSLASEWEDSPDFRAEYEVDIRQAASRLLGRSN